MARPRMTKAEREFERAYSDAFKRLANNGPVFNIMDLGKMRNFVFSRVTDGASMDDAMVAAVAEFRVN